MDIQTEINENNYDNKSAIRLIKEKTQEKALKEVKYQLDLNGAEMSYKDLLEHLNLTFMGGEDESTLMADFYSYTQKVKESEESFADELQVLAQKFISKKPNFQQGLDSVLKNQYSKQLYDHHSAAIVKSLLFQLSPQTSFTQFRSKLLCILGIQNKKEHVKATAVVTSQVGQKGIDEGLSKNQHKKIMKVAAQTA